MLDEVDATEDQQRRVVDESVEQLLPLHERHRRQRRDLLEALARPRVDRAEIEVADAASSWLADAALEAFEVLTPAQREQLLEHVHERHR